MLSLLADDPQHLAPVTSIGVPAKPDDLPEEVDAAWDRVMELVRPLGVVGPGDALVLEGLARLLVTNRQAASMVHRAGLLVRDRDGQPRTNPAWRTMRDSGRDLLAVCRELGLTPMARAQMTRSRPDLARIEDVASKYLDQPV
jgi:P27 family predicted phage terminase small subunit